MFRTNSKPLDGTGLMQYVGAIIVVLRLLNQLIVFMQALPKNQDSRVALLEARIEKMEAVLAAPVEP